MSLAVNIQISGADLCLSFPASRVKRVLFAAARVQIIFGGRSGCVTVEVGQRGAEGRLRNVI